jgi:thiamine transporter
MSAKVLTIVFLTAYFGVTFYLLRGLKLRTKDITLCGVMIALTLILESIRIPLPTGATMPCFSIIPLILLAVVCDYRLAFLSGWVCGILGILLIPEWQPIYWAQVLVEHLVCFSCMGYAGIFGSDKRWKILCGILLASALKLCGHTLSGVLFFSQDAWKGWGAWGYSLVYNVSQNVPLCILSAVVVLALPLNSMRRAVGKEIA